MIEVILPIRMNCPTHGII